MEGSGDRESQSASALQLKLEEDVLGYAECVLCSRRTDGAQDTHQQTAAGHVKLSTYIWQLTKLNLDLITTTNYLCEPCVDLINTIERTELEFLKQRERLLEIIKCNNLLAGPYEEMEKQTFTCDSIGTDPAARKKQISLLGCEAQDNKIYLNSTGPECRSYSSDDDFYWKLDAKDDALFNNDDGENVPVNNKNPPGTLAEEITKPVDSEIKIQKRESARKTKLKNISYVEQDEREPKKESSRKINAKLKSKRTSKSSKPKQKEAKRTFQCTDCNKVLTNMNNLKFHMARIHKSIPHEYMCEICGRGFKSAKLCSDHVLWHQGLLQWKCDICDKQFSHKDNLRNHKVIHEGKATYQCDLCGKSFVHSSSFRKHNIMHSGVRSAACDICGLTFMFNAHLRRHRRKLHGDNEKKFKCEVCHKKFADKDYLATHMRAHDPNTPVAPQSKKRYFRCEMCEEKFDRLFKLELHLVHDHKQVLKKGPPKPRYTWKRLQRELAAAEQSRVEALNAAKTEPSITSQASTPAQVGT